VGRAVSPRRAGAGTAPTGAAAWRTLAGGDAAGGAVGGGGAAHDRRQQHRPPLRHPPLLQTPRVPARPRGAPTRDISPCHRRWPDHALVAAVLRTAASGGTTARIDERATWRTTMHGGRLALSTRSTRARSWTATAMVSATCAGSRRGSITWSGSGS